MANYRKKLGFGVVKHSDSPNTRYETAREHIRADEPDKALAVLDEIAPELQGHEWHFLRGCALREKGDHVDSVYHLERAYAEKKESEEYWNAYRVTHPDSALVKAEKRRRRTENGMDCCCECCAMGACECVCEGLSNGC